MKKLSKTKKLLWIGGIAIVVVIAALLVYFTFFQSEGPVSNKLSVDESQVLVDDVLGHIAKGTASGAKYIMENTKVTVKDVEYGDNKDIILHCEYTALDVEGALSDKINDILASAYSYYAENTNAGKKINATKIHLHVKTQMKEYLEAATPISGEITLYIYETNTGMQLHLSDDVVDEFTGGLITVVNKLKKTNTVKIEGQEVTCPSCGHVHYLNTDGQQTQEVDITKNNTLRTGITDCISLENYSTEKPVTGNALQVAWADFTAEFHKNFIKGDRYEYLLDGLVNTLSITLLAALLGVFLGFLVAVIRCTRQMTGNLAFADGICKVYLTVIRGTPVMVQLLILFFVVLLPMGVDKFTAAVLCFGLNSGAYVAEIVRGGIMSIDKGQIEAGRSLGFNYVQTMFHFVIPQAFKAILPSLANEFITLLKESSVAFYIGVADLTQGGLRIRSLTYSNFMPLIAVAVIYLILVMILTKLVALLERRLAKSDH